MTQHKKNLFSRRTFLLGSTALGIATIAISLMSSDPALAATPKKGGHFVIGLNNGSSTNTLDPALSVGGAESYLMTMFGERLVRVAPDGSLIPVLAESWDASDDAKEWHFKIRSGIKFHDGKELTAEDVLKTMQRHSNEDSKSGALGIMRGIESMSVEGNTFNIVMSTPNADLPYLLSDYHLVIQANGGMDNSADGIGTGPYVVKSTDAGVRYELEKFADYWNDKEGHYDTIEAIIINDATARGAALQSGQVHAINKVPPRTAKLINRNPDIEITTTSGRGHYVFIMHTNTAPFDNKDLRLALKYAINREEMVDKILRGYGSVGNDIPINEAYPLFDDGLAQREFSIEKAREHYKKSGHDGTPIVLRVSDAAFAGAIDAAQLFQQSAQAAGIPLEIKREPDDGYWSEVWNKQPFSASFWSGRPVQDQMYSVAYLSSAEWNDTRFNNVQFDEYLLAARAELDQDKRKAIYKKMGEILWEEGGLINPMFNQFIDGYSIKVRGVVPNPVGDLMDGMAANLTWFD